MNNVSNTDLINNYIDIEQTNSTLNTQLIELLDPVQALQKEWRGRKISLAHKLTLSLKIIYARAKEIICSSSRNNCDNALNVIKEYVKSHQSTTKSEDLPTNFYWRANGIKKLYRMKNIISIILKNHPNNEEAQQLKKTIAERIQDNEIALEKDRQKSERSKLIDTPVLTQQKISDINGRLKRLIDALEKSRSDFVDLDVDALRKALLSSNNFNDLQRAVTEVKKALEKEKNSGPFPELIKFSYITLVTDNLSAQISAMQRAGTSDLTEP